MKRIILLLAWATIATSSAMAQEYNEHDLGKLKAFLVQPSATAGKSNGEILGLNASEMSTLLTDDSWVDRFSGLSSIFYSDRPIIKWSESLPRRITEIYWSGTNDESRHYPDRHLAGDLDLSGCESLERVSCQDHRIYTLDVSGCVSLRELYCYGMPNYEQLRSLDVTGCSSLTELWCYNNSLTSLDLTSCASLTTLYCGTSYAGGVGSKLTALDVSANLLLTTLDCWGQRINWTDVTVGWLNTPPVPIFSNASSAVLHVPVGTKEIYKTTPGWSAFGTIVEYGSVSETYHAHDLSKLRLFLLQPSSEVGKSNGEQLGLSASDISTLSTSDAWVEKLAGVSWSDVSPKRIISIDWHDRGLCGVLDVSGLSSLSSLNCSQNVITSLDISSLPALSELWCHGNPLSDITVSWQEPKSITSLGSGGSDWMLLHLPLVLSSTLHVPAGSAALYRAADGWGMFRTITESPYVANINVARPEVIVFVDANLLTINSSASETITLYSTSGVILYQLSKAKGITTIALSRLPRGVILVSGSSGWVRKILR